MAKGSNIDMRQLHEDMAALPTFGTPAMAAARKKQAQANAKLVPPAALGGMPLAPGQVYQALTAEEKEVLEPLGWKEGDPIPSNFAEQLDEIQQSVVSSKQDATRAVLPEGLSAEFKLQTPQIQDISELPPAKQQELRAALALAKQAAADEAEAAKMTVNGAGPGVNDAIRLANMPQLPLVDDRQSGTYAGTQIPKAPQAGAVAPPVPAEKPEPAPSTNTSELIPHHCPLCGWDQAITDVVEVTENDKNVFTASILGDTPFSRDYLLLDGKLQITVRALTQAEIDACFIQSAIDYRDGEVKSEYDRIEQATRYQVCLQLQRWSSAASPLELPASLDEWPNQAPADGTKLPQIAAYMFKKVFRTSIHYRLALHKVMAYNRLVARLEVLAQQPDFSIPTSPGG